nr:phage integrase SAM-like domain-containing protein [Allomuricauda sp.]
MGNRMLDGKVNINNFKENLFQETSPIFYKAAIGLLPQDYIGTKLSALRSFDSYFPDITFNEISSATVDRYIRNLREKGNSPGGIDSYVRSLKALWNKLSNKENPFKGHRIPIPPRIKKVSTPEDIRKLASAQLSDKGLISSYSKLRDYWLLMFYFGGIDPEVLARLRYDRNIQNGRLVFNRGKGGSNMPCNNIIAPQALEILGKYDCRPYLVPIYRSTSPKSFIRNFRRGLIRISDMLELGVVMHPKSARYSFIDRAQQELIDERITAQIVGHKRRTTTSLYTNDFPIEVQDKAHLKIISLS